MSKLSTIRVRNYRCFLDHTVALDGTTIIVGKNNAGKSTLIETLRLASIALKRFNAITSTAPPDWLDDRAIGQGQRIDLSRLGLWASTLFHRYGDPPAIIEAAFDDGAKLELYIGPEGEAHTVLFSPDGRVIRRAADKAGYQVPKITILPQIVPLEREERVLREEYVLSNLDSHLASRHFRNQINVLWEDHFGRFREIVEESWPGVRVDGLEGQGRGQGALLQLLIRDGNFVAEAGWMGHGLQMWLQTLWFVVRTQGQGTIVLDEPDVYMHPDLQRRLIRLLRSQNASLIVATHSTEILSEVDASHVLVLDRSLSRSSYATDMPAVQRIVEEIGSAQNLQIARLWNARSLILVEGDDMKILKRIYDLVSPASAMPLDAVPNWSIGGWNGWSRAIGSVVALHNSVDQRIRAYCVFDSDYHLETEKNARAKEARDNLIELHILEMKEIENYLVIPSLIRRAIEREIRAPKLMPSENDIQQAIAGFVMEMMDDAKDCYVTEFLNADRSAGPAAASRKARQLVSEKRAGRRGDLGVVSGKQLISKMSAWSKATFDVSFGVSTLLRLMRRNEIDHELEALVLAIANARPLR